MCHCSIKKGEKIIYVTTKEQGDWCTKEDGEKLIGQAPTYHQVHIIPRDYEEKKKLFPRVVPCIRCRPSGRREPRGYASEELDGASEGDAESGLGAGASDGASEARDLPSAASATTSRASAASGATATAARRSTARNTAARAIAAGFPALGWRRCVWERVGTGSGFALACLLFFCVCCDDDRTGSCGGFMYCGPWLFLAQGPGKPGRWCRVAPHVWCAGCSFVCGRPRHSHTAEGA